MITKKDLEQSYKDELEADWKCRTIRAQIDKLIAEEQKWVKIRNDIRDMRRWQKEDFGEGELVAIKPA